MLWRCPTETRLEEHLAAGEPADSIARHLTRCGRCQDLLSRLRAERETLNQLREALEGALPDDASNAVQQACRRALKDANRNESQPGAAILGDVEP